MIQATGRNGFLSFDGTLITITKTGERGPFRNSFAQGERYILARHVTAVEFQTPTKNRTGYIAFDYSGKNPSRGGIFDMRADENAIVFSSRRLPEFEAVRDTILAYLISVNQALDATYGTHNGAVRE